MDTHLTQATTANLIFAGIGILFLILLASFFSACETALTSISSFQLESYFKKKKKKSVYKWIKDFFNNYEQTLATILLGSTLVNVASTTLATWFFITVVNNNTDLGTIISTVVMIVLMLVLGEYVPKAITKKYDIQFLVYFSWLLYFFHIIFYPITVLTKLRKKTKQNSATEKEVHTLVEIIKKEGVIDSNEEHLVKKAFEFDDKAVSLVMTKIEKCQFLKLPTTNNKIIKEFNTNDFSRLPVIENNKFIGFLKFKTFFKHYYKNEKFDIREILDPIVYISQYTKLDDALREMQINQTHIMLVRSKTGSKKIVGLVTLENILEYLIGEVYDENDEKKDITIINSFTWKIKKTVKATDFFNKVLKDPEYIEQNVSIYDWVKTKFKIKRIQIDYKYQNDKYVVVYMRNSHEHFFIVEQKKL